jgi:predicted RNase H-like HicB family nuclease
MTLSVELEREDDGRWLAEVPALPGVLTYEDSRNAALARVQALALRILAERLEHGEEAPEFVSVCSLTA